MLTESETAHLARCATTSRTPDVISFLRALAQTMRLADIAEAIDVVVRNCEVNGALKRGFLTAQVPGILTNNYFTLLDRDWYEAFARWTVNNAAWAEPIKAAASASGKELARAVHQVESDVRGTM